MTEILLRYYEASWKELGTKSEEGETMTYDINCTRRLCSATSPAGVPKISSSAMMREMKSSTLFAIRAVSCRLVCKMTPNRMPETNFAVDINSRNGHQDGLERTRLVQWRRMSCRTLVHRIPAGTPWDWVSTQRRVLSASQSSLPVPRSPPGAFPLFTPAATVRSRSSVSRFRWA